MAAMTPSVERLQSVIELQNAIAAAKRRYPEQDIVSDDVADALHIMALGLSTI